ncbi:MAG: VOC family protein [Chloroflexi bacterium]|nr:VOC family protein [Chloroflexota bacterium]
MLFGVDHLVILARDLGDSLVAYERLGFTVTPGGEHPGQGTHNALIPFADGAYIELIAFRDPDRPQPHRWWPHLSRYQEVFDGFGDTPNPARTGSALPGPSRDAGELSETYLATGGGLIDFALRSDDLAGDVAALAARGLLFDVVDGHRLRPDGQSIAWRMALPAAEGGVPVPFLIQDVTPRSLRVPDGRAREHANGAIGVASVSIAVDDLGTAGDAYAVLLGSRLPTPTDDARVGAASLTFSCAAASLILVERAALADRSPACSTSLLAAVGGRGPGAIAAALESHPPVSGHWLDVRDTQGALLCYAVRPGGQAEDPGGAAMPTPPPPVLGEGAGGEGRAPRCLPP